MVQARDIDAAEVVPEDTERAPKTAADGGSTYDAFISYSHAADDLLAPSLRNGLQRFATPWRVFRWRNPVRALRIFQDQASLSANPALWPPIENALGSAEWFILLASPEAANSPWVEKEIDFWRRNKPIERLLIVQTDGDIVWDHDKNDFDWAKTTALPRRLSTGFAHEPRWIDARWARTGAQASVRDPRFRDLVAELAAPLRGLPKDELIGEDIRQHRRLSRWRNAALTIVTALFIGAVAAAAIAVQQRQVAIEQRQAAIAQRDQAQRNQSRALAELADSEAEHGSPATAMRVALATAPRNTAAPERAYAREAEGAVLNALQNLRELGRFRGHEGAVFSVAFSPDGRTLATGSADNSAQLWDVATGKQIATLRHELFVSSVAFSPDGRNLATASHNLVQLWDIATSERQLIIRGQFGSSSVAFSPDGFTLAGGSSDKTARLWDVKATQDISVLRHESDVTSIAFSPEGRILATGSDNARLWEVATRKQIATLPGHEGYVYSVAFSPDGRILATGSGDKTARLWEVATGKGVATLRGHESEVWSVAFSPDGRTLATASGDNTARVWSLATGQQIASLRHNLYVTAVAFSPDGRTLATGSGDNTARVWDLATGQQIAILRHQLAILRHQLAILRHQLKVSSVSFSSDGLTLATGSQDKIARVWDWVTGQQVATLGGHESTAKLYSNISVAFSPDGSALAASEGKTARVREMGQRLIDLACARVRFLPFTESEKQRFGIEDEWCTPEVSGALRAKLGLDKPETSAALGTAAR